ncbi:GNAT family N-acetyltransferase [Desulfonema magnum]|uniref:GNAT domain-containing protein n=1 Tax=Desulfonema magnum TaxID=45655 RepID=A0A975BWC5_9BACT|nr:GNAT family N-acetyltransferase [Desulfonema magnum]QTA92493.1 GNAT domain-containing protein [Desulfonema magnum]
MSLTDKKGYPFEVKNCRPEDYSFLEEMYDAFSPKGEFQGMPPRDKHARTKWIQSLIEIGKNFLAWQDGRVVGHVAILPDFDKANAEYLIFLIQTVRGRGIGKELTLKAIEGIRNLGLSSVWLTVDAYNFKATRLYRKIGFEFLEEYSSASERMMVLKLET